MPELGIEGLGTRAGSRTLGELMGNMASAESLGVQGPHTCIGDVDHHPPQGKKMFLGGGSELRM